jgi:curved DNA-binding protein CbpA
MAAKDYYAILQVSSEATSVQIRRAYRRLAREFHPDLHPSDPRAEQRQRELNEAYEVLGDPRRRAEYERQRRQPHPPVPQAPRPAAPGEQPAAVFVWPPGPGPRPAPFATRPTLAELLWRLHQELFDLQAMAARRRAARRRGWY